jgi:rhodanese-related sulfurtransferase
MKKIGIPERIDHRAFKDRLYATFARLGKALASPHRLEILDLLAQGERTVEALAKDAGMSIANASQHLQVLRGARLVEARRAGSFVHYRLADESVFRLWQSLRDAGTERLPEVEHVVATYLGEREALEPVDAQELLERIARDDVVVLDVRPASEFRAGHIRGARSVPLEDLATTLRELPPDTDVIAYCRGPYCVWADEAVAALRAGGIRARRLATGFPDWRAAGHPVESGPTFPSKEDA